VTVVRVPETTTYVQTIASVGFNHDRDEEGLPECGSSTEWYSRSMLDPGVICQIICVIEDGFLNTDELVLRPVKKALNHMTARVFTHAVKPVSPLMLLALQADAESEIDGV